MWRRRLPCGLLLWRRLFREVTMRTPWLREIAKAVGYARSDRKTAAARENLKVARGAKELRRRLKKEIENDER